MFSRTELLDAFDRLGVAARDHRVILDIALYGGSALMLASNFRFATEDVDIAELAQPWPEWLSAEVAAIARRKGWSEDWLNDAVQFHLSPLADTSTDHLEFGTFPRHGEPGLRIVVPSLEYMLVLKLKAMRINDPVKGEREAQDIRSLPTAANFSSAEQAIAVLAKFFPRSAREPDAQRFYLKHIWPEPEAFDVPPEYPVPSR